MKHQKHLNRTHIATNKLTPKNRESQYDFNALCEAYPELKPFVFENQYQNQTKTIDFSKPAAVKALNTALLKLHYNIKYWEFPDANLCPPIPGRMTYIDALSKILKNSKLTEKVSVLDIGTGATCIYPLLGHAKNNWTFVGTDVDSNSIISAQRIIDENKLTEAISLRLQNDAAHILTGVLKAKDKFTISMCNPPFFKSEGEADAATQKKLDGLGKQNQSFTRNFSGTSNELWYPGGEKAFLHNYLYESSLYKTQSFWFTSLVSKKEHAVSMKASLEKLKATTVKVIDLQKGNKWSRLVVWTFLTEKEQKEWKS